MSLKAWNGSAWVIKPLKVWNGTAWVAKTLKRWTGSAWVAVTSVMTASVSPSSASGNRLGAGTATTNSVTATPDGGVFPYTYAWSILSGTGISITNPSGATTQFSRGVTIGEAAFGTARCVITDSVGNTASSGVNLSFSETS